VSSRETPRQRHKKGGEAREVCHRNHWYPPCIRALVDRDAHLTFPENESDGGEQTMPRGVATAGGRRLDGGSSRLDLAARRTSMTTSDRDPGDRASSAGIVPMSAFGRKADIART